MKKKTTNHSNYFQSLREASTHCRVIRICLSAVTPPSSHPHPRAHHTLGVPLKNLETPTTPGPETVPGTPLKKRNAEVVLVEAREHRRTLRCVSVCMCVCVDLTFQ